MIGPSHSADPISISPHITGSVGRAWSCDLEALRQRIGKSSEDDGTLAFWVIEAPWAHPIWHSYHMALLHLRPMADGRPTKFYLEGATHEIWLHALDPDGKRQPLIEGHMWGKDTCQPLTPINFSSQFIEQSDDSAKARCEKAIQRICDGTLSPDTDYVRHWMHLFGDCMVKGDKKRAGETRIITPSGEIIIPAQPGPQDLN